MKNLIHVFIGVVITMVFVFVGINQFGMAMQKRNAEVFHDKVTYEIESSDFSSVVISNAIEEARVNGYALSIDPASIVENKRVYKISMGYNLTMPLLNVKQEGTISGYAR